MLLDQCSRLRLRGGDSLDYRGQRLCGSGLFTLRGVLGATAPEKEDPPTRPPAYCKKLYEKRCSRRDTRTHFLSTSIESQESFFDTPTHDGEERGGRACWERDVDGRSVQHCIQLVRQVVKHGADVVQDGHRRLFTGRRTGKEGFS